MLNPTRTLSLLIAVTQIEARLLPVAKGSSRPLRRVVDNLKNTLPQPSQLTNRNTRSLKQLKQLDNPIPGKFQTSI